MSSIMNTPPEIRRHPEAMYVRFADLPHEVSLEVADNFVVDFSPDNDIVGLEILWDEAERAGSEPALLAFGMFASAVVWRGYHHHKQSGPKIASAVIRKVKDFIASAGLQLSAHFSGNTELAIQDENGKLLLCADLRYYPQNITRPGNVKESRTPRELLNAEVGKIRLAIDNLAQTTLRQNPGAIGVAVFVDEIGTLRYSEPVPPGKWVTWPESAKDVSTHITIIPSANHSYSWLPDTFLDFPK